MTQQQEVDAASVVPTSLESLLAEEWTINPYSTLPSFLEMIFMEQADAQARKALVSAMEALQHTLTRRRDRLLWQRQQHQLQQTRHSTDASSSTMDRILISIQSLQLAIQDVEYRLVRWLEHLMRNGSADVATLVYYLMQRHSLASSSVSATISEAMYGGRRVKVAKLSTNNPPDGADKDQNPSPDSSSTSSNQPQKASLQSLTRTDQTRLALLLALGPFIETKLNTLHQHWKQQQHQQRQRQFGSGNVRDPVVSWKRLFLILYPLARASIHGANWICQWRFLIGHSVFFNLPSVLLQQVVRRVTQQDKEDPTSSSLTSSTSSLSKSGTNKLSATSTETAPAAVVKNLGAPRDDEGGPKQMVKSVVVVAAGALVVSWLTQMRAAYQQHQQERLLLATRNASTFTSSSSTNNTTPQQLQDSINHHDRCPLDSIPPPPPPPCRWTATMTPSFLDQCPLCQARPRVQPAASSSGFVFCYKCILAYVRRHAACPMTKQPCSESRIVRLYEPHS